MSLANMFHNVQNSGVYWSSKGETHVVGTWENGHGQGCWPF